MQSARLRPGTQAGGPAIQMHDVRAAHTCAHGRCLVGLARRGRARPRLWCVMPKRFASLVELREPEGA